MGRYVLCIYLEPAKNLAQIRDVKIGTPRLFSLAQMKRYLKQEVAAHTHALDIFEGLRRLSHAETSPNISTEVMLEEVLDRGDQRPNSLKMKVDIKKEVDERIRSGIFRILQKLNVPPNATVLPRKFFNTIITDVKENSHHKALLVVRSHLDRRKGFHIH